MPKQASPVEVNTFVGGLVTDATPLTFPDNSSLAEDNFVLNTEGDRQRRLGMDFEESHSTITTTSTPLSNLSHTSYRWENAGGDSDKVLLVVQFGNEIKFFNLDNETISSEVVYTHVFTSSSPSVQYDFAVVDGLLVVVTGKRLVTTFEYDLDDLTISYTESALKVRDLFGVEDIVDGKNLFDGSNVSLRPTTKTDAHIYNLRNQSWAIPRRDGNNETDKDPITIYFTEDSKYPSNSDTVSIALYPDPNDTGGRTVDRFFAKDLVSMTEGSTEAPKGHFIIDALERGASRLEEIQSMKDRFSSVTMLSSDVLRQDETVGGSTVVTEFAGRVFYSGFSGNIINGDSKSPRMSSYILFSRLVREPSDINKCYQANDPTSSEEPDLVDTDGGFIRLDEAFGIKSMVNVGSNLFVFAVNGVWRVVGNEESGFSATGYKVVKITERGIVGSRTIIEAEGAMVYWADDGIYRVNTNQFGDWVATSLSANKIDVFYSNISTSNKINAQGYYDAYDKTLRWVYNTSLTENSEVRELVINAELGSFYTNTIYYPDGEIYPKVVGIFEANPFTISTQLETVVVGSDVVQVDGEDVVVGSTSRENVTRNIMYVTVESTDPVVTYSFSLYSNTTFVDWLSVDDTGTDAYAYMLTGYISGGDFQRQKQITFMTTYFRKTETGFVEDVNGDFVLVNPSSCLVQTQWDWTNDASSNRFSSAFQAYRLQRVYFPEDSTDQYEDGHTTVYNRHKIRGRGRVVSIKFSTEPGKDCHLYGWSMITGVNTNV